MTVRSIRDRSPSDAVSFLDPPGRVSPDRCDTSRAVFSYGLVLIILAALIVTAFVPLVRVMPTLLT